MHNVEFGKRRGGGLCRWGIRERVLCLLSSEGGVTLVEVLVSIVILSIVMLGGLQFFVVGAARVNREAHRRAAVGLARGRMEELVREPYDSVVSGSETGLSLDDIVCSRVTRVRYVDDPGDGLGADDSDDSLDYKEVTVVVLWTEGSRTDSLSMETVIAP